MIRVPFELSFDPPAPVLPVHIGGVGEYDVAAMLRMLVDTGADCTLVPTRVARSLRLPLVDKTQIEGVAATPQPAFVHAARVRVGTLSLIMRVVAFGDEALLGRDLLNRLLLRIDGPAGVITAVRPTRRTRK
jgi:predicted aspartyl protease